MWPWGGRIWRGKNWRRPGAYLLMPILAGRFLGFAAYGNGHGVLASGELRLGRERVSATLLVQTKLHGL
jgi:hypothetical protein